MRSRPVFFAPEWVFLALGLLAGALLCVFVPFGAGFDEETHLVRVYDLAGLHLLPNRSQNGASFAPGEFFALSYQRRALLTPAQDLFAPPAFTQTIDRANPTLVQTRSIYPPPGLAAQAVLARLIWLKYDLPVVPGTILLRLVGLLVYLAGTWLAIRSLPFGKWVLVILALAPMALFTAATVNTDGFNNALSFLFVALALRSAVERTQPLRWREVLSLGAVTITLGLAKPAAVLVLPLLFLLAWRKPGAKWQWLLIGVCAAAALAVSLGWNSVAMSGSHFDAGGEQSLARQLDLILADPWAFGLTFLQANLARLGGIYQDWVGVYGHWLGAVPLAVYWLYPLALAAALLTEPPAASFTRGQRALTAGVFLLAAGGTELLYFAANYVAGDPNSLGRQGRYFSPLAPLLFLAVAGLGLARWKWKGLARGASLAALGAVLALYGLGLHATYYTYCGAAAYTGERCVQPVYKNLDIDTAPEFQLTRAAPLAQTFTSVCGAVSGVDVLVRSVPASASGGVRLALLAQDGQILAERDVDLAQIQPGQFLALAAPLDRQPAGKIAGRFTLRLELLPGSGDSGPGFGIAVRDDYPSGALSIAGNERGTDLIFHYFCATN